MTSPSCWDLKVGSGWAPCENTDRKPETALRPSPDPLDRDDDGQHTCGLSSVHNDPVHRSPEAREPGPDRSSQMHEAPYRITNGRIVEMPQKDGLFGTTETTASSRCADTRSTSG